MPFLVHRQVASGFADLIELLVESLVTPVEKVDLWPVKGRVIVLVVVAIFVAQIPRPDRIEQKKRPSFVNESRRGRR